MVMRSVAEFPKAPAASDCKIWVMGKIQKALSSDHFRTRTLCDLGETCLPGQIQQCAEIRPPLGLGDSRGSGSGESVTLGYYGPFPENVDDVDQQREATKRRGDPEAPSADKQSPTVRVETHELHGLRDRWTHPYHPVLSLMGMVVIPETNFTVLATALSRPKARARPETPNQW